MLASPPWAHTRGGSSIHAHFCDRFCKEAAQEDKEISIGHRRKIQAQIKRPRIVLELRIPLHLGEAPQSEVQEDGRDHGEQYEDQDPAEHPPRSPRGQSWKPLPLPPRYPGSSHFSYRHVSSALLRYHRGRRRTRIPLSPSFQQPTGPPLFQLVCASGTHRMAGYPGVNVLHLAR